MRGFSSLRVRAPLARLFGLAGLAVLAGLPSGCKSQKPDPSAGAASASLSGAAPAAAPAGSAAQVQGQGQVQPLEWAAGQWTRHRIKLNQRESTITYKVLERKGDESTLEVIDQTGSQKNVVQMVVALKSRVDPKDARIKSMRVKLPTGQVQQIPANMLEVAQGTYDKFLGLSAVPNFAALPREDVAVAGGKFPGSYRIDGATSFAPAGTVKVKAVYVHMSVPISSVVKVVADDGSVFMELLGHGTTGAQSEF